MIAAGPAHRTSSRLEPLWRAWLRLLRAPNLLTVPGDALAGYFLACGASAGFGPALFSAIGAGLLLYCAGLVMNDWADLEEDRRERPNRPLAAGRISIEAARAFVISAVVIALAVSAYGGFWCFFTSAALAATIWTYNGFPRRGIRPIALMATCRFLNVLLGVAAAGQLTKISLAGAILIGFYVAALTTAARSELSHRPGALAAWSPAAVLLAGFAWILHLAEIDWRTEIRLAGTFFLSLSLAGGAALRLRHGSQENLPGAIGLLISALLPLQAGLVLASGAGDRALAAALSLLVAWPLNRLLARRFAAS